EDLCAERRHPVPAPVHPPVVTGHQVGRIRHPLASGLVHLGHGPRPQHTGRPRPRPRLSRRVKPHTAIVGKRGDMTDSTARRTPTTPAATQPTGPATDFRPAGLTALTPMVVVSPAAEAIDFYTEIFGARVTTRMDGPDGSVWHAELDRSEEHTSELQSRENLVCRLLLEKKKKHNIVKY